MQVSEMGNWLLNSFWTYRFYFILPICLDGSTLQSHENYGQCQTGIGLDVYPEVLLLIHILFPCLVKNFNNI